MMHSSGDVLVPFALAATCLAIYPFTVNTARCVSRWLLKPWSCKMDNVSYRKELHV